MEQLLLAALHTADQHHGGDSSRQPAEPPAAAAQTPVTALLGRLRHGRAAASPPVPKSSSSSNSSAVSSSRGELSALLVQLAEASAFALQAGDLEHGGRLLQLAAKAARKLRGALAAAAAVPPQGLQSALDALQAAVVLQMDVAAATAAQADGGTSRSNGRESAGGLGWPVLKPLWALLQSVSKLDESQAAAVVSIQRAVAQRLVFGGSSAAAEVLLKACGTAAENDMSAGSDTVHLLTAGGALNGRAAALQAAAAGLRPPGLAVLARLLRTQPLGAWDQLLGSAEPASDSSIAAALLMAAIGQLLTPSQQVDPQLSAGKPGGRHARAAQQQQQQQPPARRGAGSWAAAAAAGGLLSPQASGAAAYTEDCSDQSDSEDGGGYLALIFSDALGGGGRGAEQQRSGAAGGADRAHASSWHEAAAVLMQQLAAELETAAAAPCPAVLDAVVGVVGARLEEAAEGAAPPPLLGPLQQRLEAAAEVAAAASPAAAVQLARRTLLSRLPPDHAGQHGRPGAALRLATRACVVAASSCGHAAAAAELLGAAWAHLAHGLEEMLRLAPRMGGSGGASTHADRTWAKAPQWLLSANRLAPLLALTAAAAPREQGVAAGCMIGCLAAAARQLKALGGDREQQQQQQQQQQADPTVAASWRLAAALAAVHAALELTTWLLQGSGRPLAGLGDQLELILGSKSSAGDAAESWAGSGSDSSSSGSSGSDRGGSAGKAGSRIQAFRWSEEGEEEDEGDDESGHLPPICSSSTLPSATTAAPLAAWLAAGSGGSAQQAPRQVPRLLLQLEPGLQGLAADVSDLIGPVSVLTGGLISSSTADSGAASAAAAECLLLKQGAVETAEAALTAAVAAGVVSPQLAAAPAGSRGGWAEAAAAAATAAAGVAAVGPAVAQGDVWQHLIPCTVDWLLSSGLPQLFILPGHPPMESSSSTKSSSGGTPNTHQLTQLPASVHASCLLAGRRLLSLPAFQTEAEQSSGGFNCFGSPLHLARMAAALSKLQPGGGIWRASPDSFGGLAVAVPPPAGPQLRAATPSQQAMAALAVAALCDAHQRISLAGGAAGLGGDAAARVRLMLALPGICAGVELAANAWEVRSLRVLQILKGF